MFKAEKSVVVDFLTVFIWGMITIFMVVFLIVFKQVSDNNHFSAYASSVISRHGGLTQKAKSVIDAYSENHYNGRYFIESEIQEAQHYGTPLTFIISNNTKVLYFDIPIRIQFSGSATSRIR
ncbi:hypothetical protein AOC36_02055 [Erysipelothrix larvae]|uniref:DUF4320 domain-containing protein n=1 Tax=Erysipelothrix larvae TaxID=1514105 RepID=A0A0X8GYK8_9FIRM|nr:hypothetical protein [Erysipelothrix larvae]AMC92809.1 hypothetical protein AOC36_02055 [Erysipelothrix larvae]